MFVCMSMYTHTYTVNLEAPRGHEPGDGRDCDLSPETN